MNSFQGRYFRISIEEQIHSFRNPLIIRSIHAINGRSGIEGIKHDEATNLTKTIEKQRKKKGGEGKGGKARGAKGRTAWNGGRVAPASSYLFSLCRNNALASSRFLFHFSANLALLAHNSLSLFFTLEQTFARDIKKKERKSVTKWSKRISIFIFISRTSSE